jgi:RimJ/RimL family protein N-acetyltransferase
LAVIIAGINVGLRLKKDANVTMKISVRPGVALAHISGPVIETERLILRTWRASDIVQNTAMLADPETARYITPDRRPVSSELNGWRNAAVIMGHWALHGFGMFAVEEKTSGRYIGRIGPWCPPTWPGLEVGWGIAREFRGKGYAVEGARSAIDWVFDSFAVDRIVHCIDPENVASQGVARRLGATVDGRTRLSEGLVDLWVTTRKRWRGGG